MKERRNRSQFDVRTYLGPEVYERVLREAAARRMSLSKCIRLDLREYYAIQDELTATVRVDTSEQPVGPRIMHTLLAQMEARIAAGMGGQVTEIALLRDELARLRAMVDRHYLGMMLHLAEVPESQWEERSSSATSRHRAWIREVEELLEHGEEASEGGAPGNAGASSVAAEEESEGPD